MSIHNITLRAKASATESEERVKTALSIFLFDGEIEIINTEGHFGNPITIFLVRIKGKNCSRFIEYLKAKLPEQELDRLRKELDERMDDDCSFHIRFDKQAAYKGIVQLATTTDTIAADIKIKAYPAKRKKAIEVAEKIFN
ncbi:MAG TPA: RNA-binding domain-containing protein [Candidatus Methanoperedens sp.]